MNRSSLRLRAVFLLGMVVAIFGVLIVRLAQIQLGGHDHWLERGSEQYWVRDVELSAKRGAILDRRGRVLAHTVSLPSLALDPVVVGAERLDELGRALERHIGMTPEEFEERLTTGPSPRYKRLRRVVRDRDAVVALEADLDRRGIRGLIVRERSVREYPHGETAAHVLGFTNSAGKGLEGLEARLEDRLAGTPGRETVLRDARQRHLPMAGQPRVDPVPGQDVHLTLDLALQEYAEEEAAEIWERFEPEAVIAAVVDVSTGDLLAVANRPTFDPNRAGEFEPETRKCRFFVDSYPPGSTFKPLVMALALECGAARVGEMLDCSGGVWRMKRRRIGEDGGHDYGVLTPRGVIAKSSNVGMAQLSQRIGMQRMWEGVHRLGFGVPLELRWPGQPDWSKQLSEFHEWKPQYSLASVSIGQEVNVTPAQMVAAYATVANGGRRAPLRLVADDPPEAPREVLSPRASREVLGMLREVFVSGTAKRIDDRGYALGGKTGTAQDIAHGGNIGAFACVGPVDAPRLAVYVATVRPKGKPNGSRTAAPFATRLLARSLGYLGIAPAPSQVEVASAGRPR